MKKKTSKAQKIREALANGEKPADIAKRLKTPIQTVYTINWSLKKKGINLQSPRPRLRMSAPVKEDKSENAVRDFIKVEISWIDNQIEQLRTIRAFLAIREAQLKPSGDA